MNTWLSIGITTFLTLQTRLFAQGEESGPPTNDGFWQTLVMLGIFIIFFYLILWRPEQKRRKALEQQRDTLTKGDKVVAMGIIGHVVRVADQTAILKMYDGSKIEVLKGAITEILPASDDDKKIESISDES